MSRSFRSNRTKTILAAALALLASVPVPADTPGDPWVGRILGDAPGGRAAPPAGDLVRNYRIELVRGKPGWNAQLYRETVPWGLTFCHPDDARVRVTTLLAAVTHCAEAEGVDLEARLQKIVDQVREKLRDDLEGLPPTASAETRRALETRATRLLREGMIESGWVGDLVAAWNRHAGPPSSCCLDILRRGHDALASLAERQGFRCDDWMQYLQFCTSDRDEVASHLFLEQGLRPPREIAETLDKLIGSGWIQCLARIVREDDPGLAARILRLRLDGPVSDKDAINRRARELWRRRGVDRWYEIVRKEGKVPEKLRLEILQCAGGYLPPVVETADEPPSPSSRPVR